MRESASAEARVGLAGAAECARCSLPLRESTLGRQRVLVVVVLLVSSVGPDLNLLSASCELECTATCSWAGRSRGTACCEVFFVEA